MQDKWHLLYCACSGTGTTIDAQRPYVARYSDNYTATDLRIGNAACSGSETYSFLTECYVPDENIANVKSDPAIDYLFEMPPTLDADLSGFMVDSDLQRIVSRMEIRGYTATLNISLTFRDLYRSLIMESIIKNIFIGATLSNDIDLLINRRGFGRVKLRLTQKGIFLNNSVFQIGLTARQLILEVKKERKRNDSMKKLFNTHMDVPHIYKPGIQ